MARAEPLILAFDTAAGHCAAALVRGDRVLAERLEPMQKGQAERLFPMLEEMLAGAGIGWRDLGAIGVGTGPGNFTGVRISVAAARGLALSLGIRAAGVTALESAAEGLPRPVTVLIDARRGEFYAQDFDDGTACLVGSEALAGLLERAGVLTGPGAGAALAATGIAGRTVLAPAQGPAVAIARIAARRLALGDLPRPAPLYLRAADAAPPADPPPVILG